MHAPTLEKRPREARKNTWPEHEAFRSYESVAEAGHSFNKLADILEAKKDDDFHPHGRIMVSRQDEKTPGGEQKSINEILLKTVDNRGYYSFVGISSATGRHEDYVLRYEAPSGESGGSFQVSGYSGDGIEGSREPERFTMLATEFAEALIDAAEELSPEERQVITEVLTAHQEADHSVRTLGGGALNRFFAKLK